MLFASRDRLCFVEVPEFERTKPLSYIPTASGIPGMVVQPRTAYQTFGVRIWKHVLYYLEDGD